MNVLSSNIFRLYAENVEPDDDCRFSEYFTVSISEDSSIDKFFALSYQKWSIPCKVSKVKCRKNGEFDQCHLSFHPDTLRLAESDPTFAKELENAGFDALSEYFGKAFDWKTYMPEFLESLDPDEALFTQTKSTISLLWRIESHETVHVKRVENLLNFRLKNLCLAILSYGKSAQESLELLVVRAPLDCKWASVSYKITSNVFVIYLEKYIEVEIVTPYVSPWRNVILGPKLENLCQYDLPEKELMDAKVALAEMEIPRKIQRALTVIYRTPLAALIDISNIECHSKAPLTVVTTGMESLLNEPPDSLSSSPESVVSESDVCASSGVSASSESSTTKQDFPALRTNRSHSETYTTSPVKGILKRRPMFRSASECYDMEPPACLLSQRTTTTSSNSFDSNGSQDGEYTYSLGSTGSLLAGFRKSVRFCDDVQQRYYRANSSILGQRKKNQRKTRNKIKRRNSTGDVDVDIEYDTTTHIHDQPKHILSPPTTTFFLDVNLLGDRIDTIEEDHLEEEPPSDSNENNTQNVDEATDQTKKRDKKRKKNKKSKNKMEIFNEDDTLGQRMAKTKLLDHNRVERYDSALGQSLSDEEDKDDDYSSPESGWTEVVSKRKVWRSASCRGNASDSGTENDVFNES